MGEELLCMPDALVFADAAQETSLDHLPLEARGGCISGSHGNVTFKETALGRLPSPGHREQTGTHPRSFSERGQFVCLGAMASGWAYRGALSDRGPVDVIFVLILCFITAYW